MNLASIAGLALVGVELWLVGFVSRVEWPTPRWALASVALQTLVGAALLAIAQLVLALLGVGFAPVPLVLLVAAALALLIRFAAPRAHGSGEHPGRAELAAWLALGLLLLAATVRAFVVPEAGWDAYSHWGLRAQAYFSAGSVANAGSEHEYYPPLVPLLQAWLYLHLGRPSIDLAKTVWALVGSSFAICLGWHLRLLLRPTWLGPVAAALIVASTTALLEGFWTGQADLPLTASLTLATLAAWRGTREPLERAWLVQAVVSAAAALTKLEGTPRILVVAVVLYCMTRSLKPALALAIPALAATLLWTFTAQRAGISPNSEHLGAFQPAAIGPVLVAFVQTFAGIRTGGVLVVAALAWLVAWRHLPRALVTITLAQLALTIAAFLLSDTSPDVEVRTSATRLFEQFLPVALVAAAVGLVKSGQPIIGPWR